MAFARSCLVLIIHVAVTTAVYINGNDGNTDPKPADIGWEKVFENENTIRQSVIPLYRHGKKLYWMGVHFRARWPVALQFCESLHMKLLTIHSSEENERVHKYIREASKGTEYWIGGTRLVDGSSWVWMPYGTRVEYTNWSNGQPSSINEKCLQLWIWGNKLEWNDRNCNAEFFFICERYIGANTGSGNGL